MEHFRINAKQNLYRTETVELKYGSYRTTRKVYKYQEKNTPPLGEVKLAEEEWARFKKTLIAMAIEICGRSSEKRKYE
jgi:hypothetical protein